MDSAYFEGISSLISALGISAGSTTASLSAGHLAQIASGVSLANNHLAQVASSVSLTNRHVSLYEVIRTARPQVCQMALGGVPLPVRADDALAGESSSIRHRWLSITNGAATMAIGWGLMTPVGAVTRTLTNSFLVLPNSSLVISDVQAFANTVSNVSQAALYAFCASTSSGARSSFMWHQLPLNLA